MSESGSHHEEEAVGRVYDSRLMRRLLGYLAPYRWRAVAAVLMIITSTGLHLIGPLATAVTLDLFVMQGAEAPSSASQSPVSRMVANLLATAGWQLSAEQGVLLMAGVYAAALLIAFVVLYAQGYIMEMTGQMIMDDLRRDVFGKLQRLSVSYFDRHPIGRLVTRATTDIAALNELFTAGLVSIFGDIFLLIGIVAALFILQWELALVSFSILPLLLVLTFWFKLRARQSFREVRVHIARINAFIQEHIGGMSVVQLFNRQRSVHDAFDEINAEHKDASVRAIFYYAVYFPSVELITALGLALIVWFGGGQILAGTLSFGALVAFLQYAQRFYRPLAALTEKYNILQAAMASSERIFELLDAEIEIQSPKDAHAPDRIDGSIVFDQVTFSYVPGEEVLQDVSFEMRPGETVAVVGHTGAGKSTLANLLLRFYDVDRGTVLVDGVDVRQWNPEALRKQVAMVLQDVFLFAGDVAANIRLGNQDISEERLRWAAQEVQADAFIRNLPQDYQTPVLERGAGLSVGQKQLIAFARALAFDPRILILDEATASIDTETEQLIQQALERLLTGRTSLVIAHRLSTIQKADRILVMHKGRVREQGTHQELLAARGIYYRLHQLQYDVED